MSTLLNCKSRFTSLNVSLNRLVTEFPCFAFVNYVTNPYPKNNFLGKILCRRNSRLLKNKCSQFSFFVFLEPMCLGMSLYWKEISCSQRKIRDLFGSDSCRSLCQSLTPSQPIYFCETSLLVRDRVRQQFIKSICLVC